MNNPCWLAGYIFLIDAKKLGLKSNEKYDVDWNNHDTDFKWQEIKKLLGDDYEIEYVPATQVHAITIKTEYCNTNFITKKINEIIGAPAGAPIKE